MIPGICTGFCTKFADRMKEIGNPNELRYFCACCRKYCHQDMIHQYRCKCCTAKIRVLSSGKPRGRPKGVRTAE